MITSNFSRIISLVSMLAAHSWFFTQPWKDVH